MKRKDWKIKNLKKGIYGKLSYGKLRKKNLKERFLFLRKLFLRRNKYLIKKNLFFNYFFFKKFLNTYKLNKQLYLYKLFFKTKLPLKFFFPEHSIKKNVFNDKHRLNKLLKNNSLNLNYLPNKYTNVYGLNYFITENNLNFNKNEIFVKSLLEDDNTNLLHFKKNLNYVNNNNNNLNFFFNYNVYNSNLIEIYKIIVILTIFNLNGIKN